MSLNQLTAHQLSDLMASGQVTCEQILWDTLDRIEEMEGEVNAFITVFREQALQQGRQIDERRKRGEQLSPLAGIPVAIKDNICVKGQRTTCGSRILENFVSPYDATVVSRLRDAGLVLLGKTNMDEFAMGSSNENSSFGPVRNPNDLESVPGGSSGGSAAALAACETVLALGSDTGGSIRQPAGFCGVVGLKPTHGRVSRYGLVAFASSLDQIGPMARDVRDTMDLLQVIAGLDPKDSTSANKPVDQYRSILDQDVRGARVGVPQEYFAAGLDPEVGQAVNAAIARLERRGAVIEQISLPHTQYAISTYYILATAEASSNLARYDGARYGYRAPGQDGLLSMYQKTRQGGFGVEVKRRIMLGTYALSAGYYDAYYLRAQKVRTLIKRDFDQVFQGCDVIIAPTSPTTAFRLGEKLDDPLAMYLSDVYTISANLAGIPAISVPLPRPPGQLPMGIQIMGKPFDEAGVFRVALRLEEELSGEGDSP